MSKISTKHIADEAINNAKLANMTQTTFKGRKTASTGVPEDISMTDARTMLNVEDGATSDQVAADVAVTDTDGHYIGTDVEVILAEIGETRHKAGWDKYNTNTQPDLSFVDGTLTFSTTVKGGQSDYSFWVNSKLFTKTGTESVVIPDVTGTYYTYFDQNGVLQYTLESNINKFFFYNNSLCALIYWNATQTKSIIFGAELHAYQYPSAVHGWAHNTFGALYGYGLAIEGLSNGGDTFTQVTSGSFRDEDIQHLIAAQSTAPFIYRLGATGEWTNTTATNTIGHNAGGTYDVWNEDTGSTWQLTEGGSTTDFFITFFIDTPDLGGVNLKKILSQSAYSTINNARNAIESEITRLVTEGLPSPEFIFIGALIVKRDGQLQELSDGSLYLDLRDVNGTGAGTGSAGSNYAEDIITDTTNFNGILSVLDINVQRALDTLDEISDATLPFTDITTGDVSTSKHGFAPKGNGSAAAFLNGQGAYTTPAGSGNVSTSGTPVINDFAKFVNATDIEGRSYAEVRTDLNVEDGATADQDLSGLVVKVTGSSLVEDTEIAKIHASGSDDQDLSGLVVKVTGSSLVEDTEISKIHASGSDDQDLSGLVVKVATKSLVFDTEISKIHASGSDDQDLSGLVVKVATKSLVFDTEISKIHASGSDDQDLSELVVKVAGSSLVADTEIAKIHAAVTVTDTAEIDLTLTGQDISASLKSGSIDETKLDTSVNASLDKADSAIQTASTKSSLGLDTTDDVEFDIIEGTKFAYKGTNINSQTGTTYTLVLTDSAKWLKMSNAGAITLTVPPTSGVAFPIGTLVEIGMYGAGEVTIAPGSGVTIRSGGAFDTISVQYNVASIKKIGTEEWWLVGCDS